MTEATLKQSAPPRHILLALILVAVAQSAVLIGEWLIAHYPVWTGTELRLRVQPVDPRDMFRGNYVRLGYHFSTLPMELGEKTFSKGDVVYVSLQPDDRNGWAATAIHADKPDTMPYLRARVMRVYLGHYDVFRGLDDNNEPIREQVSTLGAYRLRYGIEAWFAPKLRAQEIERELVDGGWVKVKVAESGRAALVEFEAEERSDDGGD